MSSTVLVPNLLVANRIGVEELTRDGPGLLPFDSSFQKKRKTSSIVHDTRSFKRRKFSRTYIERNLANKRGNSRFSRRRHHEISSEGSENTIRKLQTHEWNAKRMHMKNICGQMVPIKSQRHGVKAVSRLYNEGKTFVHDESYHSVFQVICKSHDIAGSIFNQITDPNSQFFETIDNGKILSERTPVVEHTVLVYEKSMFPVGLIGPCKIISGIMYNNDGDVISLKFLISSYPGIKTAVMNLFGGVDGVTVEELSSIDRLTLYGISTQKILHRLSGRKNLEQSLSHDNTDKNEEKNNGLSSIDANLLFLTAATNSVNLNNVWRSGYLLPVAFPDPRQCQSRIEDEQSSSTEANSMKWPKFSLSQCPLWTGTLSEFSSLPSDYDVNKAQRKSKEDLLSNLFEILGGKESSHSVVRSSPKQEIPVFIIRHRTSNKAAPDHYISDNTLPGFSLLLPRSWTKVFWQECINLGALPIGIDELAYLRRANNVLTFPHDYLDSDCGWQHYQERLQEVQQIEQLKPPAKRLQWPFQNEKLLSLYNNSDDVEGNDFAGSSCAVVRRAEYLQHFMVTVPIQHNSVSEENQLHEDWNLDSFPVDDSNCPIPSLPGMPHITYVHIKLTPTGRGQVHPFAVVFHPTVQDLKLFILQTLERRRKFRSSQDQKKNDDQDKTTEKHFDSLMIRKPQTNTVSENHAIEESYLCSNEWAGVDISQSSSNHGTERVVLGTVTSGDNENGSNDHIGIAMCRVDRLHEMMRCHYLRFDHPLSHRLILFQNPGSSWIRPALLEFMS